MLVKEKRSEFMFQSLYFEYIWMNNSFSKLTWYHF